MSESNVFNAKGQSLKTELGADGIHTLRVQVVPTPAGGSAVTEADNYVTAAVSAKDVLGASTTRKGAFLYAVPGSGTFYGKFGAVAPTTAAGGYDFRMFPDDTFQIPSWLLGQRLQGIWDSAAGGIMAVEGS